MRKPIIIAEAGCNHKGDMQIAKKLIKTASLYCKADIIKFQKRNICELLSEEEFLKPHPDPINSYGSSYGEHRKFLEFDIDQHKQLNKWCTKYNIEYSSSVWDITSASEIIRLKPKKIKIPSACNLNKPLLELLCESYTGEIHLSLGMTSKCEEKKIVELFIQKKRNKDLVLYYCAAGYPAPFNEICLLEIKRLKEEYEDIIKSVGFSGHHLGIALDSASISLGAHFIERHFTLDRTWKGTDHAASLEPDGLRKLVRDCKVVNSTLKLKSADLSITEQKQREKLKINQIKW